MLLALLAAGFLTGCIGLAGAAVGTAASAIDPKPPKPETARNASRGSASTATRADRVRKRAPREYRLLDLRSGMTGRVETTEDGISKGVDELRGRARTIIRVRRSASDPISPFSRSAADCFTCTRAFSGGRAPWPALAPQQSHGVGELSSACRPRFSPFHAEVGTWPRRRSNPFSRALARLTAARRGGATFRRRGVRGLRPRPDATSESTGSGDVQRSARDRGVGSKSLFPRADATDGGAATWPVGLACASGTHFR
jgi:hypothetical protein